MVRLIVEAGGDGIAKIVEKFVELHPDVPKRQVEMKINEMAFKDKRGVDTKPTWYLKSEFEKYASGGTSSVAQEVEGTSNKTKASKKRKIEKEEDQQQDSSVSKEVKEPKKFKRAFGLYVRDHREEADEKLGDVPDVSLCLLMLFLTIFLTVLKLLH